MRKLPRDLVLILRTEAKNQRTPPIDYVIAEDGGRMVHRPEPDIAMAELLEEAATALEAQAAELAAVKTQLDCALVREGNEKHRAKIAHQNMNAEINARERAEAAHAETKRERDEALKALIEIECRPEKMIWGEDSEIHEAMRDMVEIARRVREGGKADG